MKFIKKYLKKKNAENIEAKIEELLAGSWAIGYDDRKVIESELFRFIQYKTINIIEFGSGASTLIILVFLIKNFQEGSFVIFEEDLNWFNKIKNLLDELPLKPNISIKLVNGKYSPASGFDLSEIENKENYQIIFIDAPPDDVIADGRYLLALSVLNRLGDRGVLMIHDIHRNMELFGFAKLREKFLLSDIYNTKKGMGVLRFPNRRKS